MSTQGTQPLPDNRRAALTLLGVCFAGALVAVSLGVYGRIHPPTGRPLALVIGFSSMTPMKAWLGTLAVVLACFQVVSARIMWTTKPPSVLPTWVAVAHRWSGAIAFLLTLPVAYHCLWSLGFSSFDARTTIHSVAGCVVYGAFTSKMLALRSRKISPRSLPVMGGLLFAALITAWLTASLWYFTQSNVPLR
ncbi:MULTISPECIES: DUF6529 family protein [unclassified Streptomyces]|uniref:DUF6529 family protein n=1 Tax=unclassified Streptomyces TaxID=2593676 RepID=UPI0009A4DFC4|nr:DUF6529 family protein [Streptomyces sp. 3211]